jgi:hypothetical protein
MADYEISLINEQFEKKEKNIRISKTFVRDTKRKTIEKLTRLKKHGNEKLLRDSKIKLTKVQTMKTKEKYIQKVIATADKILSDYEIMNDMVLKCEAELTEMREKYIDFKDVILKHLSQEKKKVAQIRGNSDKGIFLYGESKVGSRTIYANNDSIFSSKFLNVL